MKQHISAPTLRRHKFVGGTINPESVQHRAPAAQSRCAAFSPFPDFRRGLHCRLYAESPKKVFQGLRTPARRKSPSASSAYVPLLNLLDPAEQQVVSEVAACNFALFQPGAEFKSAPAAQIMTPDYACSCIARCSSNTTRMLLVLLFCRADVACNAVGRTGTTAVAVTETWGKCKRLLRTHPWR